MILRQFLHTDPTIAASYLFGCGGKAMAAVVDPIEHPRFYLDAADETGMRIRYVVDTHVHADHISTGRALARAAGAAYVLHEDAGALFPFAGVQDGDRLELGNVSAEVLHVPGHTPEHIALLVTDRTRSAEPWFVITGHTLMVGDMGRTELASSFEDGARALFASTARLRTLADYVEVMPGAFSGSVCGRSLSGKPSSTIGFERRFNRAFAIESEPEFLELMRHDIPMRPPRAAETRALNMGSLAAMSEAVAV